MSTPIKSLTSYLPTLLQAHLAATPTPRQGSSEVRFQAAVLFADISGYTPLTERFAERGAAGVEALSGLLNEFRGQLLDLIGAHDGDVVKFAGDSLYALWPADPHALFDGNNRAESSTSHSLADATQRATQCALAIQAHLQTYHPPEEATLSLKVSIASGEVVMACLGGVYGRWLVLVAGTPLQQVAAIQQQAHPGQVILTSDAWALIAPHATGLLLTPQAWQLQAVAEPLPQQASQFPERPTASEATLRAFIPAAILTRLAAGQSDWLAELRQITVLFIHLPDLNHNTPLAHAQEVVQALQLAVYRYEGSISELSGDDKGVMLVVAFGLPPLSHQDDAARGVQAALAAQATLQKREARFAIGIATARLFCGSVGSEQRREYALIGAGMNLAARLMQAASSDILCDPETYEASKSRIEFEALPPLQLKGKAAPVPVYRPLREIPRLTPSGTTLVGRTTERGLLIGQLLKLLRSKTGSTNIIEGEAGIGKSRLLAELQDQARRGNTTCLVGVGDAIERTTAYFAWRPIFSQIFGLDALPDSPAARRATVMAWLQMSPDAQRLAPLLNAVLPLDLPDNEVTAQMSGQVRADNIRALLLDLLLATARQQPILLVLEDAHWLDSASWALALALATRQQQGTAPPLMLLLATRPLAEPLPTGLPQLLQAPTTQHLHLEPLPPADALALVCQRLGVASLPGEVVTLIREKAEGHPFFSEELAYALRDLGLIEIKDGICRLVSPQPLHRLKLPTTIEGTITSRIDRLPAPEQLTLKVASVIGRTFPFRTLQAVHPIAQDRPALPAHLSSLARLDLTPLDTPEPDLAYIFKHIITQEVAYNLMLFDQRRQLHRAVAEWYEQTHASDLAPYAPLLAHHWQLAQVRDKALAALEQAGAFAMRNGAYQEALRFFSNALALGSDETALRRAHWEFQLGEAYYRLGQSPPSQEHLEAALALFGWPVPRTPHASLTAIGREALRQLAHRVWPGRFLAHWQREHSRLRGRPQLPPPERKQLLGASRAAVILSLVAYTTHQPAKTLYTYLLALNLAERAGPPSPELALAYAAISILIVPFPAIGRAYYRWAEEAAREVEELSDLIGVWFASAAGKLASGQFAAAHHSVEQMAALSYKIGDWRHWENANLFRAVLAHWQGRFQESIEFCELASTSAARRDDQQMLVGTLLIKFMNLLPQGRIPEALATLEAALPLTDEAGPFKLWAYGGLALTSLAQGELSSAHQYTKQGLAILKHAPSLVLYGVGPMSVIESSLALLEHPTCLSAPERRQLTSQIRWLCRLARLGRWSVKPIQPAAWRAQGLLEWLDGHHTRAQRAWRTSLTIAEQLGMPYEQARTHYELGRHATGPERYYHLARARALFEQMGASYDLAQAQKAAADQ
jgi:class 3 adenylate cyclase